MTDTDVAVMPEHADPRSGFRYVGSYHLDGRQFTVDIWAHNMTEAQRHVWALRNTLVLDGQVYMRDDIEGGLQ